MSRRRRKLLTNSENPSKKGEVLLEGEEDSILLEGTTDIILLEGEDN